MYIKEIETCATVFWGEMLDKIPFKKKKKAKPQKPSNSYAHGGVLAGEGRDGDFV